MGEHEYAGRAAYDDHQRCTDIHRRSGGLLLVVTPTADNGRLSALVYALRHQAFR